jgi:hypothetical protein
MTVPTYGVELTGRFAAFTDIVKVPGVVPLDGCTVSHG